MRALYKLNISSFLVAGVLFFADTAFAGTGEREDHNHQAEKHMSHMMDVKKMLKKELGSNYDKPLGTATEENIVKGKEIYSSNCASCHGLSGKGDGLAAAALPSKPADFTDSTHSGFYSDQGRLWIIKNGITGTPMVGWGKVIGENGAFDVLSYVKSLASGQTKEQDSLHSELSDTSSVLRSYLAFGDALASDNSRDANKAVGELESALKTEKTDYSTRLVAKIQDTAKDAGLSELRKLYGVVSEELVPAFEAKSEKVNKAFCPMAHKGQGGYWLQEGREIRNPYFGSEMLACGEFSKIKEKKLSDKNGADHSH